jgi:hypothetical protein
MDLEILENYSRSDISQTVFNRCKYIIEENEQGFKFIGFVG